MDFDIKKPLHIIALVGMLITIFVIFVYPALTFFHVFPTISDVDVPTIPEDQKLFYDVATVVMQLVLIVVILIIIPFLWYILVNKLDLKQIYARIKLTVERLDQAFLWGVLALIITYAIVALIGFVLSHFDVLSYFGIDETDLSNIPEIEKYISFPSIFIIAAVQPIAEEIFFRGFLLEKIESYSGSTMAIFSTSVLFGVAHMVYGQVYPAVIPIIIGLILGYIVVRTRNLYSSIIAHILFNVSSLILYYFAQSLIP